MWLWQVPVNFGIALYLVINLLGAPALLGLSIMVVLLPLTTWLISQLRAFRTAVMRISDERVAAVLEVVQGVRLPPHPPPPPPARVSSLPTPPSPERG